MKFQKSHILLAEFITALALLGGVVWFEWQHTTHMQETAKWVEHTEEVRFELSQLLSDLQDSETGERGFIITDNPDYLEPFEASLRTVAGRFSTVRALTSDNPRQQINCDALEPLINQKMAKSHANVDLRRNAGFEAARHAVAAGEGKALMDRIRAQIFQMDSEEHALLEQRSAATHREARNMKALIVGGAGFSFILLIMVLAVVLRENRLRQRAEQSLRQSNEQLEQRVQERTEALNRLNEELELRVEQRTHQLAASNTELESFSYSVSHDLRAPLRHVQGYAELLTGEAGDQLSEKARHYLATISDASQEMGVLIDDLLSFSRMGRAEMAETTVQLDVLVRTAMDGLELSISERNIVWKIPPLPAVQGDPAMLKQVFANLLANAVKYTRPRDPAEIEIGIMEYDGAVKTAPATSGTATPSEGGSPCEIVLFVRDNGVGFDPQYTHKLFGVFQRLHHSSEFEGTGIGLANVRRIIDRHGGRVWAEGTLDKGATFYFTLKVDQPNPIKQREQQPWT